MYELYPQVVEILQRVSRDVILPRYKNLQAADIEEKSPGDLVTIADKLSEEMLSESLGKLLPEAAIIGEEAAAEDPQIMERLSDNQAWIIDPIDGTGNFAAGRSPFGVIIALTEANETVAGWLYDPTTDRVCHAVKGVGSFINEVKVQIQNKPSHKPIAALATGFMTSQQREAVLTAAEPHYQLVPIPSCAAEQYPLLVQGHHHMTVFERTLPWDHAAGVLFLNEAGGKAARWDGSPYLPGEQKTGMLGTASPKLWDEAAEHLSHIFLK